MRCAVVVVAVLVGSCGSGPTQRVDERAVVWPTLRLWHRAEGRARSGPGGNEPAAELGYGRGSFAGGAGDYELWSLQARVQVGTDPQRPVSVRLLGGLEYLYLALDGASAVGAVQQGNLGPLLGLDASWNCWPRTWLYLRGTGAALLPGATSTRAELGLSWWPIDGLELAAGYRRWRARFGDLTPVVPLGEQDFDLHQDGVVLTLGVVF